jgi:hypothetical protein
MIRNNPAPRRAPASSTTSCQCRNNKPMPYAQTLSRYRTPALTALLLSTALATPAFAQTASSDDIESQLLIQILVKKGVLSSSEGHSIITQARSAAAQARQEEAAVAPAPVPTPAAVAQAAPAVPVPSVATTTAPDGAVHVTYIPPNVRAQIAQQVEQQVLTTEQQKGYAAPNEVPDWVHRIKIYGDIRTRYEGDFFPNGNDTAGDLTNFNAINTGAPYDVSSANNNFPPQLNANANRNRFRIRARLGVDGDLGDGWDVGFRIATGENDSPVSENQSLGAANNAQGGNFSKYAIWLDRAWIGYSPKINPNLDLTVKFGRFDNPFFTTPLIWADDIGMDGIMATADYRFDNGLTPFITLVGSPIFDTDFNFSSNQPDKFGSEDKYMLAVQAGAAYKFNDDYAGKLAIANYAFTNVQGKLSAPCLVLSSADSCSTDDLRPSFAQNGNTYMALRNILPTAANDYGATGQYQYFGLASRFDELAITGEFDVNHFDPTDIWINGEYVRNLSFNKNVINANAVNNRSGTSDGSLGGFAGGPSGYYINASVGQKELVQLWDWNASVGYRYIESDAVIDAFNDSDFGLGGTNLKGYTLRGNLALNKNVWLRATYMSADSIAGPTYNSDLFQLDLNAKF